MNPITIYLASFFFVTSINSNRNHSQDKHLEVSSNVPGNFQTGVRVIIEIIDHKKIPP